MLAIGFWAGRPPAARVVKIRFTLSVTLDGVQKMIAFALGTSSIDAGLGDAGSGDAGSGDAGSGDAGSGDAAN